MKKVKSTSNWCPDYISDSVLNIDTKKLKSAGITHIVFDLDNTLVKKRAKFIANDYTRYLDSLSGAGFTLMLGSNRRDSIDYMAESIKAIAVKPHGISMKPFKSYYDSVRLRSGTSSSHLAMVGDHILNDVFGANRAGFTTIMVVSTNRLSLLNQLYIRYIKKHYTS